MTNLQLIWSGYVYVDMMAGRVSTAPRRSFFGGGGASITSLNFIVPTRVGRSHLISAKLFFLGARECRTLQSVAHVRRKSRGDRQMLVCVAVSGLGRHRVSNDAVEHVTDCPS